MHECSCFCLCSGKTSLLFQHALACSRRGSRVLYICPRPLSKLPLYHLIGPNQRAVEDAQIAPPPDVLERITFRSSPPSNKASTAFTVNVSCRYPPDLPALQELCDTLHLKDAGPWHKEELGCIIVDDFHKYCSSSPIKVHPLPLSVVR